MRCIKQVNQVREGMVVAVVFSFQHTVSEVS